MKRKLMRGGTRIEWKHSKNSVKIGPPKAVAMHLGNGRIWIIYL